MSTNPFEFLNSINFTKKNLMEEDPSTEKAYLPFIINTSLSYFPDTIEYANAMNCNYHLDNKLQYSFLINKIRPRKRFSKWVKKNEDEDVNAVSRYFGYNITKTKEAMRILTSTQIEEIKKKLDCGGVH